MLCAVGADVATGRSDVAVAHQISDVVCVIAGFAESRAERSAQIPPGQASTPASAQARL